MGAGNTVVVVVIVSMGLLLTVLSVGLVRLRANQNQAAFDTETDISWEGAPNITVNPLEVIKCIRKRA